LSELPISYQGTVYPWQCDHMGHMNVMWYAGKFDEATWQYFARLGMTRAFLSENNRGMAALEQTTKYLKEVHPGDILTVRTHTVEVASKTIRYKHEMSETSSGEAVAASELIAVHIDTSLRKGVILPDDVREKAEQLQK
jgi:acyl-CoA thioester hydrolase